MKDRNGEKVDLSKDGFYDGKIFDYVDKLEEDDESVLSSLQLGNLT